MGRALHGAARGFWECHMRPWEGEKSERGRPDPCRTEGPSVSVTGKRSRSVEPPVSRFVQCGKVREESAEWVGFRV